ncbi:hypothetical protein T492DRAFT_1063907 [Pavlovales sp. CCMP2436]|nr:hypothetical protein T492DRAFT_1063907 [Pavlovales sp. CCMP2436]
MIIIRTRVTLVTYPSGSPCVITIIITSYISYVPERPCMIIIRIMSYISYVSKGACMIIISILVSIITYTRALYDYYKKNYSH